MIEVYHAVLPHNMMQLRYGDDILFHNYLSQQYNVFTHKGPLEYFSFLRPEFAYASLFWFINFVAIYLTSFFNSSELLTLTPFIVNLFYLFFSLLIIFQIYKLYFDRYNEALLALLLLIFIPMTTHSGIRFHNYSSTLFYSSLLFYVLKKINLLSYKNVTILALISAALISTKLNGLFIGIACFGLLLSKERSVFKNIGPRLTLFLMTFILFFIFFLHPSLFYHIVILDEAYISNALIEYREMIRQALPQDAIDSTQVLLNSIKDHYFSSVLAFIYLTGFGLWIKNSKKLRYESIFILLCLIICFLFVIFTSQNWHSSTYLVGIIFLFPLSLKGYLLISNIRLRKILISVFVGFSFYHFINCYEVMHTRDSFIAPSTDNYRVLKMDQQNFLAKFPEPKIFDEPITIRCFLYTFCPWIKPFSPFDYSIIYNPSSIEFEGVDYIAINYNNWPGQLKFRPDIESILFLKNFLTTLKINNDRYEIIYSSDYTIIVKKI